MRLRTTLLSLASTVALVFSFSTSAHAEAMGDFSYQYRDGNGHRARGFITDPPLNECHAIPQSADTGEGVDDPQNDTDAYADLYEDLGCSGAKVVTLAPKSRPQTGDAFQSVRFRPARSSG